MKRILDKEIHRVHKRCVIGGRVKVGTRVLSSPMMKRLNGETVTVHETRLPMETISRYAVVKMRAKHGKYPIAYDVWRIR